jgi:stage III sporulation protein SpoIIIAA
LAEAKNAPPSIGKTTLAASLASLSAYSIDGAVTHERTVEEP